MQSSQKLRLSGGEMVWFPNSDAASCTTVRSRCPDRVSAGILDAARSRAEMVDAVFHRTSHLAQRLVPSSDELHDRIDQLLEEVAELRRDIARLDADLNEERQRRADVRARAGSGAEDARHNRGPRKIRRGDGH